jgi:release factor glutamine methyltransferase
MTDATERQHAIAPLLQSVSSLLFSAGRDEARLKAELLLAHVLGIGRLDLLGRVEEPLGMDQHARLQALAERVAAGEPLQYVLGETAFFGRWFNTDRRALIPRPETEELVQAVLEDTDLWCRQQPVLVDVGTGTGCVALSLAAERPAARVLAVDISPAALELARENERRLGLAGRVEWRAGDLLSGFAPGSVDAVVSNPPYVASAEIETLALEIRAHEPRSALDGGADGLRLVDRLVAEAFAVLRADGRLWLEIGDGQAEAVRRLLAAHGFGRTQVRRDLGGHERIVSGVRP